MCELSARAADLLQTALDVMAQAGVDITPTNRGMRVARNGAGSAGHARTAPFPGFPTDLQAQLMALMTTADGTSEITETIFENRFMHVQELARLGADIALDGDKAIVTGVDACKGAQVMATDLRASVSLVIAGLVAEGETVINRVYHLDRGFERIEQKLGACGADRAPERLSVGSRVPWPPSPPAREWICAFYRILKRTLKHVAAVALLEVPDAGHLAFPQQYQHALMSTWRRNVDRIAAS